MIIVGPRSTVAAVFVFLHVVHDCKECEGKPGLSYQYFNCVPKSLQITGNP